MAVSSTNQLAFVSATTVAKNPGSAYNPLFLYGGVGLGKTHLLHAIGQHVTGIKKGVRVAYVSSEKSRPPRDTRSSVEKRVRRTQNHFGLAIVMW